MTEKIDLSALRVGDKVTITFEVIKEIDRDGWVTVRHGDQDATHSLLARYTHHGTVERAPRPLEVGDRVRCHRYGPGTILAIHRIKAWVLFDGGSDPLVPLSDLTREASHD